ncbi:MAG: helix-hairpin-helix domain-containing protein [Thermoplasmata archaeon]
MEARGARKILFGLTLALLVLGLGVLHPAIATHTPQHRYLVTGLVTQEDGSPACGVSVEARKVAAGTAVTRAETDFQGAYRIQLHLHSDEAVRAGEATSSDEGATIEARVTGTSLTQTAIATAGPSQDGWGESRIDFRVPVGTSEACANPFVQAGLFIGIPIAILVAASVSYFKVIRPWQLRRSVAPSLSSLPGIGKARLQELKGIGIRNLEDLAAATPDEIARGTSIGKKEAKRLVRRAKEVSEGHQAD